MSLSGDFAEEPSNASKACTVMGVSRDTGNPEHHLHFAELFDEYVSNISTNIESSVVDKLFGLPYFHGFICYVDNAPSAFAVCLESYSSYRD